MRMFTALLAGLMLVGCGPDGDQNFTSNEVPANRSAVVDDVYIGHYGRPLVVSARDGVLANDGRTAGSVVQAGKLVERRKESAQGGSVDLRPDGSFTYTPRDRFTGTDTFTYKDSFDVEVDDGSRGVVTVVVPPPRATDDLYTTESTVPLVVTEPAKGLLANDELEGPVTVESSDPQSANGAAVNVSADGTFTYTPTGPGRDTFDYTVRDGSGNLHQGEATVQVSSRRFYVEPKRQANGDGTQGAPFQSLDAAFRAAQGVNGAEIVIQIPENPYGLNSRVFFPGSYTLPANCTLIAEGDRPQFTGPIVMSNNTTLSNVDIIGSPGDGVTSIGPVSNVTMEVVLVRQPKNRGFAFEQASGTLRFTNCIVSGGPSRAFEIGAKEGQLDVVLEACGYDSSLYDGIVLNLAGGSVNWTQFISLMQKVGLGSCVLFNVEGNAALNATIERATAQDAQWDGIELQTANTARAQLAISNSQIAGSGEEGVAIRGAQQSSMKARLTSNTLTGNQHGFRALASDQASLSLRMNANVSEDFRFDNGLASTLNVEGFGDASGSLFRTENTGSVTVTGAVGNISIGSAGIP